MKYREFVDYVKDDAEKVAEHIAFDLTKHFIMFNGEGDDGATLMIPNAALTIPRIREVTWRKTVLPRIEERGFKRLALIVAGPKWNAGERESSGLALLATIADAERVEEWNADIGFDGLEGWKGPDLATEIPDFHVLVEALR